MTGDHHFNEVQLSDVFVGDDMVVGEVGNGWHQVTAELAFERSGPERFLSTMPVLRAGVERMKADGCDDTAAIELGALVMRLAALRSMSRGVAAALDRGESPAVEAAMVKDAGTRFESQTTDSVRRLTGVSADPAGDALQVMIAEAIVHAPGFTLRGGTNEILRGVIARELGLR
jgi:alkylation response protein AidB-like acyl-CoA dehydrogenase